MRLYLVHYGSDTHMTGEEVTSFTREVLICSQQFTGLLHFTLIPGHKALKVSYCLFFLFSHTTECRLPRNNPNIVQRLFTAALLGDVNKQCQTDNSVSVVFVHIYDHKEVILKIEK